jgi:hypothetical protein
MAANLFLRNTKGLEDLTTAARRGRSFLRYFSRSSLFGSVLAVGCINGLAGRIVASINQKGWEAAVLSTFDISIIVLTSCCVGVWLVFQGSDQEVRGADLAFASTALLLIALPVGPLAWLAVTGLTIILLLDQSFSRSIRSGAVVLLATTMPMLWTRLLFHFFSKSILIIDASLVAWLLGTNRSANMVEFADHSGTLVLFEACSSLANVSLAVLCWITISHLLNREAKLVDLWWCFLACASVVAVNVVRVSLMGLSSFHYEAVHSATGNIVANGATLGLTIGICLWGMRTDVAGGG